MTIPTEHYSVKRPHEEGANRPALPSMLDAEWLRTRQGIGAKCHMRLAAEELTGVMVAVTVLLHAAAFAGTQRGAPAEPPAGAAATALALCCEADQHSGAEKQRILMQGLELAQDAVAADPWDAQAHFAVFCALGKQAQSRRLGPLDLGVIRRLRSELDTALALAPQDTDALVAKGAMLLALPWFLGGDVHQGEELLRTALIKDPTNAAARGYLAEALRSRGAENEARVLETLDVGGAAPPDTVCAPTDAHQP